MTRELESGDPVTIHFSGTRLFQAHVTRVWVSHCGFEAGNASGSCGLPFAGEGIRWIRGHHTNDSRAGRALLAAAMLARQPTEAT